MEKEELKENIENKKNPTTDNHEKKSDKEEEMFNIWTDFARGVEVKMVDNFTMEFNLETKDNNKNSLQLLLELIDESFESYSSL